MLPVATCARVPRADGSRTRLGQAGAVVAATLVQATVLHAGTVLYVDDDASAGGDGTSWSGAFRFLQDALSAAQPGSGVSEIRVGQGAYAPDRDEAIQGGTGDRLATFALVDGVSLRGGFAGAGAPDPDERDAALYAAVLSGDLLGDDESGGSNAENSQHVVTGSGTSSATLLEGFTITRGNSTGSTAGGGAGIMINSGSPTVRDCEIKWNAAPTVAGSGAGAMSQFGDPRFEDCVFSYNAATAESVNSAGGGALYCFGGSATLVDCIFEANSSTRGGALFVAGDVTVEQCVFEGNAATYGGAIFRRELSNHSNQLTVLRSRFVENFGSIHGGAVSLEGGDVASQLVNCEFLENRAVFSNGGAVRSGPAGVTISNCLMAGNTAGTGGGAVVTNEGDVRIVSCTLASNWASYRGGGIYVHDGGAETSITNSILWGNASPAGEGEAGQVDRVSGVYPLPAVDYCVVGGLTGALGGAGNLGTDPQFSLPAGQDGDPDTFADNDYRLSAASPAVDAGHNWAVLGDSNDLDGDGDTTECTPIDLDGLARFTNDEAAPDVGCGMPAVVDMGAYERTGEAVETVIPGDVDGDGFVAFQDLLSVLARWGPAEGCVLADLDLSGAVDFVDLLTVLASWN